MNLKKCNISVNLDYINSFFSESDYREYGKKAIDYCKVNCDKQKLQNEFYNDLAQLMN